MNEVVVREKLSLEEMVERADFIAASKLFGLKTRESVITMMMIADAEGRHPMSAVLDYDIVENKPVLKTSAMLARFQMAGGKVEWKASTELEARAVFTNPQGLSKEFGYSMEDARKAGLANRPNYQRNPKQMLRARCTSNGIRAMWPVVLSGLYAPEEISDSFHSIPDGPDGPEDPVTGEIVPTVEVVVPAAPAPAPSNAVKGESKKGRPSGSKNKPKMIEAPKGESGIPAPPKPLPIDIVKQEAFEKIRRLAPAEITDESIWARIESDGPTAALLRAEVKFGKKPEPFQAPAPRPLTQEEIEAVKTIVTISGCSEAEAEMAVRKEGPYKATEEAKHGESKAE